MKMPSSKIVIGTFTLPFQVTPLQYSIEKKYAYSIEPCLGQTHPLVSFESGSVRTLQFALILDEDLDEKVNVSDINQLLSELNKINEADRSVKEVEVILGPSSFKGYVTEYRYTPMRFKPDMTPTSIRLELAMISSTDHENTQ